MAGNLDMMGGLSPQSHTLGQDELLAQSASGAISDKQDDVLKMTSAVCKALGWYFWHHPLQVMRSKFTIPGVPDISTTQHITPDQRAQIPWDQLELNVDPYSLRHQTPQQRLQSMQQLFQSLILPTQQIWMQQGISMDWNAVFTQIGEWMDMPQLAEWLTVQDPIQPGSQGDGGGDALGMPAQTNRTYTRVNRPGQTSQGAANTQIQALLGGNPQNASMAKAFMSPK
jgi:hypothetical protein